MTYMKSGSPLLYDEDTGDVVGVKDTDGGESTFAFIRTDANNNTVLVGADGKEFQLDLPKASKAARTVPLGFAGGAYSQIAGTVTPYTDVVWSGGISHRMVTGTADGNTAEFRYRWTGVGPVIDGIGGYVLPIRVLGVGATPGAEIRILISNDTSYTTQNVMGLKYLESGLLGDQFLYFPIPEFVENGGAGQAAYGELYDFVVRVTNKTAGTALDIQVGNPLYSCGMRPAISIGCDDGLLSQYTELFPLMEEYGLKGTISIAKDYLGTTGYMTEAQVTEMYDAGWDVVVHGENGHNTFGSLAALEADIEMNRAYVAARWPRAADHYTYIGGLVNNDYSYQALTNLGFKTARLVTTVAPPGLSAGFTAGAWLRMQSSFVTTATAAARVTQIEALVTNKSVQTELHFHSVEAVSPETAVENTSRAAAITILEKVRDLRALGKIDVFTRSELYRKYS